MDLEEKKRHILNLCGLGVPYATAKIDARVTSDEEDILDEDKAFQAEVKYSRNHEKVRLTELYRNTASVEAAAKQSTTGVRSYLKDMYPDYIKGDESDRVPFYIPVLAGKDPSKRED